MKEGVDEQKDLTLSEVENTLVCCLLTSVDAPGLVSTLLHKEMFSDAALGFVFQAVMNLYEQGVQPDMVSVETEMRRMDEARWKELNGLSFLRTAMLNVLKGEIKDSLSAISLALETKDSESSHYAAAVLSHELNEFRIEVQKLYLGIREEKDDQTEYEDTMINYTDKILKQKVFTQLEQNRFVKM
uniref:DnaB-like helicase N-terminal domain-containing protein n=1 Tax=Parabacteroides goldsteinii TaxID=328812 RepID=UPI002615815C